MPQSGITEKRYPNVRMELDFAFQQWRGAAAGRLPLEDLERLVFKSTTLLCLGLFVGGGEAV
jgi:hypothetical protein